MKVILAALIASMLMTHAVPVRTWSGAYGEFPGLDMEYPGSIPPGQHLISYYKITDASWENLNACIQKSGDFDGCAKSIRYNYIITDSIRPY